MLIKLSAQEFEYLSLWLLKHNQDLFKKLENGKFAPLSFELGEELISDIRDWVGKRLMEVGFDKDYNPTSEGLLLENMIDRLYI